MKQKYNLTNTFILTLIRKVRKMHVLFALLMLIGVGGVKADPTTVNVTAGNFESTWTGLGTKPTELKLTGTMNKADVQYFIGTVKEDNSGTFYNNGDTIYLEKNADIAKITYLDLSGVTFETSEGNVEDQYSYAYTVVSYVNGKNYVENAQVYDDDQNPKTADKPTETKNWIRNTTAVPAALCLGMAELTTVILPAGCTIISEHAFDGCAKLTTIQGSGADEMAQTASWNSITSIEAYAFRGCAELKSFTFPTGFTNGGYISQSTFQNSGLTSIEIPDVVATIGSSAFAGCENLETITWPAVTETPAGYTEVPGTILAKDANMHTKGGTSFDISVSDGNVDNTQPDQIYTYNVYVPVEGTYQIGIYANSGREGGGEYTLAFDSEAGTNYTIAKDSWTPKLCETVSKSLTAGNHTMSFTIVHELNFEKFVFSLNGGVPGTIEAENATTKPSGYDETTHKQPNANASGGYYLGNADNPTHSVINGAFTYDFNVAKTGLYNIDVYAARGDGNNGAFSLKIDEGSPAPYTVAGTSGDGAWTNFTNPSNTIENVYLTAGSHTMTFTITTAINVDKFVFTSLHVASDGVTSINNAAFHGCTKLNFDALPSKLETILADAFNSCSSLTGDASTGLAIPAGVTQINERVFKNCSNLTSVTFSGAVTTIGNSAFYRANLSSVTIPGTVTTIDDHAFNYNESLGALAFDSGSGELHIKTSAFQHHKIVEINIPARCVELGNWAFGWDDSGDSDGGQDATQSITFEAGINLATIGVKAFRYLKNENLKEIVVPPSVKEIKEGAFMNMAGLKHITLDIQEGTILHGVAFAGNSNVNKVTLNLRTTEAPSIDPNDPNGRDAIENNNADGTFTVKRDVFSGLVPNKCTVEFKNANSLTDADMTTAATNLRTKNTFLRLLTKTMNQAGNDGGKYEVVAQEHADVILTRTFATGKEDAHGYQWNSLILPFALVNQDSISSMFGENTVVAGYGHHDKQSNQKEWISGSGASASLQFQQVSSTAAKTPYIIAKVTTNANNRYIAHNVDIQQIKELDSDNDIKKDETVSDSVSLVGTYEGASFTFTGAYDPVKAGKNNMTKDVLYISTNNTFNVRTKASTYTTTINGFRGYFLINEESLENVTAQALGISFFNFDDDESQVTAIDGVRLDGKPMPVGNVYSLNGQLVRLNATSLEGLGKGIYIVNGKKVVVK